jgi:hypothetical protein
MTVVPFCGSRQSEPGMWSPSELTQIAASFAPGLQTGEAESWDVGATEAGDPQLYLVGPPPDHDCILCVSRLGSLYVLEDGTGRVLAEHNSLLALAESIQRALRGGHARLVTRFALFWCAARESFHERYEAMIGEGEELLVHVAPQLAAIV